MIALRNSRIRSQRPAYNPAMDWVYYALLFLVLVTGWLITIFGVPGLWLMLAGVAGYAWITHLAFIGWKWLVTLVALALVAELLEFVSAGAAVKKAGGSTRGVIGAVIGGLLGGIFLTALIPVPIVGTIFGICAGTFLGAAITELMLGNEVGHSTRVGMHAAKGRLIGTSIKLGFGILILVLSLWRCLPVGASTTKTMIIVPAPTTLPATRAATSQP